MLLYPTVHFCSAWQQCAERQPHDEACTGTEDGIPSHEHLQHQQGCIAEAMPQYWGKESKKCSGVQRDAQGAHKTTNSTECHHA